MVFKRAWLTTNRTCNNHCEWCYAQNAKIEDMDFVKAIKCIDILSELGVKTVVLIGGEPTLYKEVECLIKYIKDKKMRVAIATNGRKFADDNFAKRIVELEVDSINISLKAPSEKEYIERTKRSGLVETINGYHNLKKHGFNASISYVICNDDKQEISKLINLIKENKLENILFQFVKPVMDKDSKGVMPINKMATMTEFIYQEMQKELIPYMFELSFPFCTITDTILEKLLKENRISSCCHVQGAKGIIVDTNFTLLPCNHFVDMPYSRDIFIDSKESIIQIFESETANIFRNKARCYPSTKCIECTRWDICGGGCFTRWFFENPNDCIPGLI